MLGAPAHFARALRRVWPTLGAPILTGLVVSGGVLAIQLYFDAKATTREERRGLQLELGRSANLAGADLAGRDLSDFFLQRKALARANLAGAKLMDANLRGSNLVAADLRGAQLQRADLDNAKMRYAWLERADLTGATLQLARLPQARARSARFVDADLTLAWLAADLRDADFTRAKLVNADFDDAIVRDAHFMGADLDTTSFRNARLEGADFRGARRIGTADFSNATYDRETTHWPADFKPLGHTGCRTRICRIPSRPKQSFRDISPLLETIERTLERRSLPDEWESRADRVGFTFAAPLDAARFTGENFADIAAGETLEQFAASVNPDVAGLREIWAMSAVVDNTIAACIRRLTWRENRTSWTVVEVYFLNASYGFLFSARADSEAFHLYADQFSRLFEGLKVEPNPFRLPRAPAASNGCR